MTVVDLLTYLDSEEGRKEIVEYTSCSLDSDEIISRASFMLALAKDAGIISEENYFSFIDSQEKTIVKDSLSWAEEAFSLSVANISYIISRGKNVTLAEWMIADYLCKNLYLYSDLLPKGMSSVVNRLVDTYQATLDNMFVYVKLELESDTLDLSFLETTDEDILKNILRYSPSYWNRGSPSAPECRNTVASPNKYLTRLKNVATLRLVIFFRDLKQASK